MEVQKIYHIQIDTSTRLYAVLHWGPSIIIDDMNIQERYGKPTEEFVRMALERYRDEIEGIPLFGSVARGKVKEYSDVDILIVWNGGKLEGWDVLEDIAMDILLEHGQFISIKTIYPQEYFGIVKIASSFIQNIKKEGVIIE